MLVREPFWKPVWDCFYFNVEHTQLITGPSSFFILSFLSAQILPQMMKITWNGNKSLINISVQYLKGLILVRKSLRMKHPNKNLFNPWKITSTKPWQKNFLVKTLKLRAGISEHQLITFLQVCHYIFPRNCPVPLDPFSLFDLQGKQYKAGFYSTVAEEISADIGWLNATKRQTERLFKMKSSHLLCNFSCIHCQFPRLLVQWDKVQEMRLNNDLQRISN